MKMAESELSSSMDEGVSSDSSINSKTPIVKYTVSNGREGKIVLMKKNERGRSTSRVTLLTNEDIDSEINHDKNISELTIELSLNDDQFLSTAIVQKCVEIQNLNKLDLTGTHLPRYSLDRKLQFGSMINLDTLILDDTNMRLIHPTIGQLKNLRVLSLQFNKLYDLPVTIRLLTKLEHLYIAGNLYRSLPGSVYHLRNLKTIDGLQENLLERYCAWEEGKVPIATIDPLRLQNLPRDHVETLSNISLVYAIGMNIWSIPLPNQYRTKIIQLTVDHDLCEACCTPVRKITADQETNGHVIKVCMYTFINAETVPFMFMTCSIECRDKTVNWLNKILEQQKQHYRSNMIHTKVVLKEEHTKPVLIRRGGVLNGTTTVTTTSNEDTTNTYKCAIL